MYLVFPDPFFWFTFFAHEKILLQELWSQRSVHDPVYVELGLVVRYRGHVDSFGEGLISTPVNLPNSLDLYQKRFYRGQCYTNLSYAGTLFCCSGTPKILQEYQFPLNLNLYQNLQTIRLNFFSLSLCLFLLCSYTYCFVIFFSTSNNNSNNCRVLYLTQKKKFSPCVTSYLLSSSRLTPLPVVISFRPKETYLVQTNEIREEFLVRRLGSINRFFLTKTSMSYVHSHIYLITSEREDNLMSEIPSHKVSSSFYSIFYTQDGGRDDD